MNACRFELIVFDWDGTLFDSTAIIARCIQAAVRDVSGIEPTLERANYVIGMLWSQALTQVAPNLPAAAYPQINARYRQHYLAAQHQISLFDGVLTMLADLKARSHWLAIATGKSRAGLDELLQAPELTGVFDASRTADQTAGKPDPLMLHELMLQFAVPQQRTLIIGDTTHDLQLARNAGCASVAVSYGAHDEGALTPFQPLTVAPNVAELHRWLLANA